MSFHSSRNVYLGEDLTPPWLPIEPIGKGNYFDIWLVSASFKWSVEDLLVEKWWRKIVENSGARWWDLGSPGRLCLRASRFSEGFEQRTTFPPSSIKYSSSLNSMASSLRKAINTVWSNSLCVLSLENWTRRMKGHSDSSFGGEPCERPEIEAIVCSPQTAGFPHLLLVSVLPVSDFIAHTLDSAISLWSDTQGFHDTQRMETV